MTPSAMTTSAVRLSIIVVVYRMRAQAYNTLFSLSAAYQRNVARDDYEIIVVENHSDENLDPAVVARLDGNFRYFLRNETGISPAPAVNFALTQCRGDLLGLIVDGARMLTPGIVANALAVRAMHAAPLVVVPGYHLGDEPHEKAAIDWSHEEQAWLQAVDWKSDGYRLFDRACYSPGNRKSYLHPIMECSALFCTTQRFRDIGGADERFALSGGGGINLHIYRLLGMQPDHAVVVLPGEGNFHQYHGGVTTSPQAERDALIRTFKQQLDGFWDGHHQSLRREPILFGTIGSAAQKFLESSSAAALNRWTRLGGERAALWPDDPPAPAPRKPLHTAGPALTIVVIVYRMRRQALNTLYSLSAAYQREIDAGDYEVVVVENDSDETLPQEQVQRLGPNFRYFLRSETRPTPVYAVNFGVAQARAAHVCLMIDGARMVTPRLVRYTLDLLALTTDAVVAVPGYHLGEQDQKFNRTAQHDETSEAALLEKTGWTADGYRLFDIACLSGANTHGYLHPLMESNCITFSGAAFAAIGGAHEGFQTPGGGSVNLDLYRNLVLRPGSELFVLPGEGSFHQFHGGITTAESADLEAVLATHREEMKRIRGEYYSAAKREPTLYGTVAGPALRFLHFSSLAAQRRFARFRGSGQDPWPDDAQRGSAL